VPLLAARGLACRRGDRLLFRGLDLELRRGQIVWVHGANGRGKTSLLRLLAGVARPEAGHVEGRAPRAYLGHANALKDDLTALEALQFLARLHRLDARAEACEAALRRFGLHGRRHAPVRTLSQGQRRRVALSRLCMLPPASVWLLDEPHDALDAEAATLLDDTLRAHAAAGGAVVLASHIDPSTHGLATLALPLPDEPGRA
jgi:heme exporter protein A